MIQITLLTAMFGVGAVICMLNKEDNLTKAMTGITLMVVGGSMWATVLLVIIATHVDSGGTIVDFNITRGVVATVKAGDPSYSGILMDALRKNSQV